MAPFRPPLPNSHDVPHSERKDDLTCPYHEGIEKAFEELTAFVRTLSNRMFYIMLLLCINLLLSGFNAGAKIIHTLISLFAPHAQLPAP